MYRGILGFEKKINVEAIINEIIKITSAQDPRLLKTGPNMNKKKRMNKIKLLKI